MEVKEIHRSSNTCGVDPTIQYFTMVSPWGFSIYFSFALLLTIFIPVRLVILDHSKSHTFNKLTLLPFRIVFLATAMAILQQLATYLWACDFGASEQFIYLCHLSKISFINSAIAVQIFEWLLYSQMIKFQKKHRLETVIVEMRQYRQLESRFWQIFLCLMVVAWLGSYSLWIGYNLVYSMHTELDSEEEREQQMHEADYLGWRSYFSMRWICFVQAIINFIFFTSSTLFFFCMLYRNHSAGFADHKRKFFVQALGMALVLLSELRMDAMVIYKIWSYDAKIWANNRLYTEFSQWEDSMIILLGFYILVLSKTVEDCFKCFSKVQNVKYSRFQYIRFLWTEKMMRARRRAMLISKLQRNCTEESILLLRSFESNLDTAELINANDLGIDQQFMVTFCGGSKHISSNSGTQFLTESESEVTNTESEDSTRFNQLQTTTQPERPSVNREDNDFEFDLQTGPKKKSTQVFNTAENDSLLGFKSKHGATSYNTSSKEQAQSKSNKPLSEEQLDEILQKQLRLLELLVNDKSNHSSERKTMMPPKDSSADRLTQLNTSGHRHRSTDDRLM